MESLRGSLGLLSKGISIGKPGLDPIVVNHVRIRSHGFLGSGTSAAIDLLGRQDVLLSLRERKRDGLALRADWRVNIEALFLIRRRVRLH